MVVLHTFHPFVLEFTTLNYTSGGFLFVVHTHFELAVFQVLLHVAIQVDHTFVHILLLPFLISVTDHRQWSSGPGHPWGYCLLL